MSSNIESLREYLKDSNVQAFLHVIRVGEGTADPGGYSRLFGGDSFSSFDGHPNRIVHAKLGDHSISSSAAGAYQILSKTWRGLVAQYGFSDFTPGTQDLAAVALIMGRGALLNVIDGDIETAIGKCSREWASLPGAPYGQPTMTMNKALETYSGAGGRPRKSNMMEDRVFTVEEKPMLPFVAAAIPALINAAPDLIRIFGDSPQAEKNAQAAEKVVEIAKAVTGEATSEAAVNIIQNDPAMAAAFREQARKDFLALEELADKRVEAARKFNAEDSALFGRFKFVHLLSASVTLAALGVIIYIVVTSKDATERSVALQTLLLGGFGGVMAYWIGSSSGSEKKTEMLKDK